MKIYQGPFLSISYEKKDNRFIQYWTTSPKSVKDFKGELLNYVSIFKQHIPTQVLWLQENLSLTMDEDTKLWIDQYVNVELFKLGDVALAFVVGQDALTHMEVIDLMDNTATRVMPRHFATEKEARDWLNKIPNKSLPDEITEVTYKGIDKKGNSIIEIKRPSSKIKYTLKTIKSLFDENSFIKANVDNYTSLTNREKEILHLYCTGKKHQEIADLLFVSLHTVRTHWRNVKQKLSIKNFNEAVEYSKAFNI